MQSLDALWRFFDYFRAMHDTASTLRYVDHKGQVHYVEGLISGQQGDLMEMMFACSLLRNHTPYLGPHHAAPQASARRCFR